MSIVSYKGRYSSTLFVIGRIVMLGSTSTKNTLILIRYTVVDLTVLDALAVRWQVKRDLRSLHDIPSTEKCI